MDAAKAVRRGCGNRDMRDLLIGAIKSGVRTKLTRSGILLYGPGGIAGTHFSVSDHRAVKNLRRDMRKVGIDV